ncbi:MAG TPA: ATP-binding protein [Burkholderiales bacterium]|nr:ATP-binding protein [Burkholderiales bacterium]
MTTAKRLWVGFGVLTALLVVFSAVVLMLLRSVQRDVVEQAEVARPRAAAAKQLEIHVLGLALAVRAFFQTGDPKYKAAAEREAADAEARLAEYQQLAATEKQRALAVQFTVRWREYKQFAQSLLAAPDGRLSAANAEQLGRLRVALESFVDDELQREADESYDASKKATMLALQSIFGSVLALLVVALAVALATGVTVGVAVLRTQKALAHEHGQLEAVIQAMADGVMVFDMSGNAVVVNDAEARLIGYANADEMKRNLDYFAVRFDLADLDGNPVPFEQWPISKVLRGESFRDWELAVVRKDVPRTWIISFSGEPVRGPNGQQILALVVSQDVTLRKQNEERLRHIIERYRLASDVAGLGHWEWDLEGGELKWSEEFRELYGMPPDSAPSYELWRSAILAEDFPKIDRAVNAAIAESGSYRVDFRVRHPKRGLRHLLGVGRALRADGGPPKRLIAVSMDITDLKEAEVAVRRLNLSLEQRVQERTAELAEANQEMQAFSYTVSHDLRAPLRGIQGFANALVEDFSASLGDEGRRYCERIAAAGERMEDLIEDLLDYSRLARQQIVTKPIDLPSMVREAIERLQTQIKSAQAQVSLDASGTVIAHPTVLLMVIQNLLANAITFVAKGTKPEVDIWSEDRQDWLRLNLQDNGIGIEQKNIDRIFNVFERLHGDEAYAGTGIGLAIVKRAMDRLGGTCGVESAPGKGSRFWIELRKG